MRRRSIAPLDELYYALVRGLRLASPSVRDRVLAEVSAWSRREVELGSDRRPLSADGVRELAASGIVEIGGHTVTHPVLAEQDPRTQFREASEAKAELEQLIRSPVTSFAYPYGGRSEYDSASVEAVRRAGYKRACANVQGPVRSGASVFELPRLIVGDWSAEKFATRLEQWLGAASRREAAVKA
jgi:peptidoglycan/xylan/chitin deacetylase (PgdA/CDA1 family)